MGRESERTDDRVRELVADGLTGDRFGLLERFSLNANQEFAAVFGFDSNLVRDHSRASR
jgi:hypothetical protein